jgi:uncharacterized protein (TIGR00251 family)
MEKINVKVYPNSGKQEVIKKEKKYFVYLKSAPENNKANIELMNLLKKYFKSDVKIKSGKSSKKKVIEVIDGNKI